MAKRKVPFGKLAHSALHVSYFGFVFHEAHYTYAWIAGGLAVVVAGDLCKELLEILYATEE